MYILILIIMLAVAFGLLRLLFHVFRKPIKLILKLLLHAAAGFVALFLINFLGSWIGLYIPLNFINSAVAGVLGVPGVLLLLLIQFLF